MQSIDSVWDLKRREMDHLYTDDLTKSLIIGRADDLVRNIKNALNLRAWEDDGILPAQHPKP